MLYTTKRRTASTHWNSVIGILKVMIIGLPMSFSIRVLSRCFKWTWRSRSKMLSLSVSYVSCQGERGKRQQLLAAFLQRVAVQSWHTAACHFFTLVLIVCKCVRVRHAAVWVPGCLDLSSFLFRCMNTQPWQLNKMSMFTLSQADFPINKTDVHRKSRCSSRYYIQGCSGPMPFLACI